MTEITLFIFGGVITLIVFVGILLYSMMSFSRWYDRDASA